MRNSFSLSVCFLLGRKCDVKKRTFQTSDTASGKMKLIPLILFISIAVDVKSAEHYTFPPKFHPHNSGMMSTSDSSIYLPPESHTTMPYFPIKNENNLQYPYLPMTGTKAPGKFPPPFPLMFSSTLRPNNHDDDEDDDRDDKQPTQFMRNNRTVRNHPEKLETNNMRPAPSFQPIDRIDKKVPYGFMANNPPHPNPSIQKAAPRSMIISEHQRNDAFDQFKAAAAFQGPNYLPAPGTPGVYISSTTETAIPIIRLSNEMDLDGSFSYEALGADQTHYVQHSRMENTGTDKEEQVVEGSYSYVGDNGQTYTVHYIADSKGFRASGDHLPVPPPIPEIIQRAVQYNLAEEAKKPPNLKSWQNDDKENELSESEKYQRYIAPPIRPLFTGKTPQSFSFGFGQGAHNPHNNLMQSASSQNAVSTNNDFTLEQVKPPNGNIINNGGPISPQITFLASQGAHNPSVNPQQSISRAFTTERSTMPQLVNYDAAAKEADQESNKALWRWQYGLNTNMNQTPEKNSISRSSAEGDNVIINFNDMTPEQYTRMIRSELEPKSQVDQVTDNNNRISNYQIPNDNFNINSDETKHNMMMSTESNVVSTQIHDSYKYDNPYQSNHYQDNFNRLSAKNTDTPVDSRSKLLTQKDFVPHSQTVTQSYDYEETSYEPKRIVKSSTLAPGNLPYSSYIKTSNNAESELSNEPNHIVRSSTMEPPSYSTSNYNNNIHNYDIGTQNSLWSNGYGNQVENIHKISTTDAPITTTANKIITNEFVNKDYNSDFRPIQPVNAEPHELPISTTSTGATYEDIINENFFLKNLFKNKKNDQYEGNRIREENKVYNQQKFNTERKAEKVPKFIQMQAKPQNNIKGMKKPVDIADIINYLSAKNHFESIKVKPQTKYGPNTYNHKSEVHYIPVQHEQLHEINNDDEEEPMELNASNHRTNYYHPKELQGIIKNYKVLQRNNSAFNNGQDAEQLRRNQSQSPARYSSLPPLGRAGPSMKSYLPPIYV